MRVYGFMMNGNHGFVEIENTLKAEQEFVGGRIEVISITDEIDLVCNDEGKILELMPSLAIMDNNEIVDVICGNCFLCRFDDEGNFNDIKDDDIEKIKEKVSLITVLQE